MCIVEKVALSNNARALACWLPKIWIRVWHTRFRFTIHYQRLNVILYVCLICSSFSWECWYQLSSLRKYPACHKMIEWLIYLLNALMIFAVSRATGSENNTQKEQLQLGDFDQFTYDFNGSSSRNYVYPPNQWDKVRCTTVDTCVSG